jgi:hypothetical protein
MPTTEARYTYTRTSCRTAVCSVLSRRDRVTLLSAAPGPEWGPAPAGLDIVPAAPADGYRLVITIPVAAGPAALTDGVDGSFELSVQSAHVWPMRYRPRYSKCRSVEVVVLILLIVLLVLWLILTIVGFAIKGLLWLAIIGIVLFVGTAAIGAVRRRTLRR